MLQARHVSISFGGLKAVDDASLAVPAGTITSLIGPNGAGKSTLFGILSGFLEPDTGSVSFLGQDVTGLAPHRICRLGMTRTFQLVQPFAGQTVRENIAVDSHLHRPQRKAALVHAESVALRVGLAGQLDKPARDLTIAARKRLELARALQALARRDGDRKSTRLNSSHLVISYAVFCLKKKKNKIQNTHPFVQHDTWAPNVSALPPFVTPVVIICDQPAGTDNARTQADSPPLLCVRRSY